MRLIIDSNIIIAALLRDSTIRHLILYSDLELITGEFLEVEISKYKEYIQQKANINETEFFIIFEKIKDKLILIKDELVTKRIDEAITIMKSIDNANAPVLALALSIENNGIWSDDKHLEKQNKVKVWKTKDLMEYLST
ncbi:hypothetical protein HZA96_06585 [Candidatus Woesearchaeota archaeon]|nr:hypothetical protein [Candidatus Woesearchaeota archaeon]